ncbi:hypothetical protein BXZ70DRAFT_1074201 [Cristinia sonorae]|uniref:F-box domain-containing protein n=1 Tax=Cristinia sonorae TaxID=1940300 RepID=A0A8K0XUK1_9AGAR|nr:hypothetical protein BXZ70DRAFT_1074201 [Cristinia sonorae]
MPLFRSSQPASPPPPPPQTQSPSRSRSLFSRRRSPSPEPYATHGTNSDQSSRGGFFSRRRSSSSSGSSNHRSGSLGSDPTILAARQKVSDAEAFEREADRALGQARAAVRDAREHVRALEREALEDARRAKMKQAEAKTVLKAYFAPVESRIAHNTSFYALALSGSLTDNRLQSWTKHTMSADLQPEVAKVDATLMTTFHSSITTTPMESLDLSEGLSGPHPAEKGGCALLPNPTFDSTCLPTELWLEIFRFATYVPRSRDLTVVDPFAPERLPNFAWGVNNPVLSLRTKCAVVRVCKAWRAMATELLYEHVVVASVNRAKLIFRTLQKSAADTRIMAEQTISDTDRRQTLTLGHGQWIRHLEIRSCTRNTNKIPFLNLLANILTYCTNLQVLNGVWAAPVPKEFLAVLQIYHGRTLRGLGWEQTDAAYRSAARMAEAGAQDVPYSAVLSPRFLPNFLQLRVLDLRILPKNALMSTYNNDFGEDNLDDGNVSATVPSSNMPTTFAVPFPIMTLPRVTTLRLPTTPSMLNYAARISLPALRDLLLDASNVAPYHTHSPASPASHRVTTLTISLLLFLTTHGRALTSLELIPSISSTFKPSPYPLSPGLFLQPGVCPNLERLIYDCRERTMSYPVCVSTVMGIRGKTGKGSKGTPAMSPKVSPYTSPPPEPTDLAYLLTSNISTDLLSHPHRSLRLVAIRGLGISRLYPNRPTHTQAHLLSLLSARISGYLPGLETVRTAGFLVDTSTDGMARDIFIWWTERFEYMNVDLVDGEGVLWLYEEEAESSKGKGKDGDTVSVGEQGEVAMGINAELKDGSDASVGKDTDAETKEDSKDDVTRGIRVGDSTSKDHHSLIVESSLVDPAAKADPIAGTMVDASQVI